MKRHSRLTQTLLITHLAMRAPSSEPTSIKGWGCELDSVTSLLKSSLILSTVNCWVRVYSSVVTVCCSESSPPAAVNNTITNTAAELWSILMCIWQFVLICRFFVADTSGYRNGNCSKCEKMHKQNKPDDLLSTPLRRYHCSQWLLCMRKTYL